MVALDPFFQFIGPGAVGMIGLIVIAVFFDPGLVHDVDLGHFAVQNAEGLRGGDFDFVWPQYLDLFDFVDRGFKTGLGPVFSAFDGKFDIFGGKGGAIVKLNILAQIKNPGETVGVFPFFRQRWFHIQLTVKMQQRIVDVFVHGVGGGFTVKIGVQGPGFRGSAVNQGFGRTSNGDT